MAVNNLITLRKGIATEWSSQNPTLASGEPGYDGTNNLLKIGDGNTSWLGLPPANFPANGLEGQILSKISDSSETLQWIDNYANELRATVQNNTASDISLGTVVMATGASGDNIHVAPAVADGSVEAKYILGVAAETISSEGGLGYISVFGPLNNLNTNSYDVGTVLYIDPSAAGGWTATEPTSPNLAIPFAIVTSKNASAGRIFIRMWPQQEGLHELHDVNIDSVVNGDGIKYNSSNDTWIPDTDIVHGTGTQNYVAVWTSDQLLTSGIIYDNGTNVGIGTDSPQAKLDVNGTVQFDDLVRWEYPDKILDTNIGTLGYLRPYDEAGTYCGLGVSTSSFNIGTSGAISTRFIGQGVERAIFDTNGNFIFNDNGNNCDFRIEGDTDQNLLFTDASTDSVGIGTASPATKLHIKSDTSSSYGNLFIEDTTSMAAGVGGSIVFGGAYTTAGATARYGIISAIKENSTSSDSKSAMVFYTNDAVGTTVEERMRITSDGRVGIGTASPSYKLEVNGDIGLTDSGFYASPTGVMVGTSGWLYNDGQTTLSHGNFSDNGDAQNSSYVLRTSTTNDTFTTIQNNASNVILASNRTMMFTANIVARRTNGQDNAAYKIEGVLVNDGYGASILGTPVKTIIYESDSSWDVQAILSGGGAGASDYLLIQGKGAASKNVNWVCKLDLLEVGGDISGYTEVNILNVKDHTIP